PGSRAAITKVLGHGCGEVRLGALGHHVGREWHVAERQGIGCGRKRMQCHWKVLETTPARRHLAGMPLTSRKPRSEGLVPIAVRQAAAGSRAGSATASGLRSAKSTSSVI